MVLNIVTDGGFDFGIATDAGVQVIMAQLPADELNQLSSSAFPDAIALLGGNDVFENDDTGRIAFGNTGNDSLVGGAGSDTIFGGQGEDTILGGAGNDILSGDGGFDTLTGGGGADEFIMQSSGADRDLITDFQPGVDKLRLPDGVAFTDLQIRDAAGNTEMVRNGEVLAILNGVVASSVTTNDFIGDIGETPSVAVTPGNTPSTAGDLGVFSGTRTFRDFVGTTDSNDYYRFTLNQVHDAELTLFGMDQNANLELYIGDQKPDGSVEIGNRIDFSFNSGTRDDSIARSLGAGTYFVRVVPGTDRTDTRYSLRLNATA